MKAPRNTATPVGHTEPATPMASRARMAAIIEASIDAIVTMDGAGQIEGFNRAAEEMFGISHTGAIGQFIGELLLPAENRSAQTRALLHETRIGAGGYVAKRGEIQMQRQDGTCFPTLVVTVRVPDGEMASYACFIRESTESSRADSARLNTQWQLREIARRVVAAREEERAHVARELHDELGQRLAAIRMEVVSLIPWVRRQAPEEVEGVERLEAISSLVDAAFTSVRRLATDLRPGILDDLGLAQAVRWQAREFAQRFEIPATVEVTGDDTKTAPAADIALFRIFQELLTNIARHAKARRVDVVLSLGRVTSTLTVRDDGRGIEEYEVAGVESLGLVGIRERAALLGGTFAIRGKPGGGTTAVVALPRKGNVAA